MYLGGTDDEKPEVVLQEVLQRKNSLSLKQIFIKTSWITDIHERNYIIFEVPFSIEI